MTNFLDLEEGNTFSYKINSSSRDNMLFIHHTAKIEESGISYKPGSMNSEFETQIQILYQHLRYSGMKSKGLLLLDGKDFSGKFCILIAEEGKNIDTPDQEFSSNKNFDKTYLKAFAYIAAAIINTEKFNEFAEKVYLQPKIYNYITILDEVTKSLPKETHVPIVRNEGRSI